jgi:flagellar basal-body rod protein FlgC
MKLSDISDIAASGLVAQRARMATAASNLANAETTRTAEGGPYRRRDPVLESEPLRQHFAGALDRALTRVNVNSVEIDQRPGLTRYDPGHPDANADGYVQLPRVSVVEELTNVLSAGRSFEANLIILRKVREMAEAAMQVGR